MIFYVKRKLSVTSLRITVINEICELGNSIYLFIYLLTYLLVYNIWEDFDKNLPFLGVFLKGVFLLSSLVCRRFSVFQLIAYKLHHTFCN